MDNIESERYGFCAFRRGWPEYTRSVFRSKTEIVTNGKGCIIGVTNPDKLLWAEIPPTAEDIQILEIGKGAFSSCLKLRNISFSDNLEIVGEEAFKGCRMLSSVSFADTLYEIGEGAFEKTAVKSFVFPKSVENVPARLFMDDGNLESVVFQRNIKRIGILAFAGCTSLRSIEIPEGVREIPEGAFMSSGLRTLYLTRSIKSIGSSALASCHSMESIFYDGNEDDFRRISFGKNWNRGMNGDCSLFIKDRRGCWYNAFSSEKKTVHEEDDIRKALSLFGFDTVPSAAELSAAFRRKAMAFHPDRLSGLDLDSEFTRFAEEKFRLYKSAYDTILPYCRK